MTLYKNKYRIETTRLRNWDYRKDGVYFVTICTKNRAEAFGRIENGEVRLSGVGEIAAQCWSEIPIHHTGVMLDEFVIMPNHVHGLIVLNNHIDPVEPLHCNGSTKTISEQMAAISPKTGSLGSVVRSYKSAVSRLAHQAGFEFGWQERYWDHIVRNDGELGRIRNYIIRNPVKWEHDQQNPQGLAM
jgi:REP element-mobilizing transposase RayT